MKRLTIRKRIAFVALAALAMVMTVNAPSQAAGVGGNASGRGHGGGAVEHHGFEGQHFEGHHFEGRHFEGHDFEGRHFGFGPVFPYYAPYYAAPSYWYYCPSYGAYYPSVTSCPEPWVTVPAS